jgi:hypothetical protein
MSNIDDLEEIAEQCSPRVNAELSNTRPATNDVVRKLPASSFSQCGSTRDPTRQVDGATTRPTLSYPRWLRS